MMATTGGPTSNMRIIADTESKIKALKEKLNGLVGKEHKRCVQAGHARTHARGHSP